MKETPEDIRLKWITPSWKPNVAVSGVWTLVIFLVVGLFVLDRPKSEPTVVQKSESQIREETRWLAMQATLSDIVRHYDGDVGIYIKDLKTGRVYEHNADDAFVSASLIKMPIMVATFQAIWEGRLSLNTKIKLQRQYRRDGSGVLKWARSGASYPLSQLIYAMMTRSDNTATAMVIDQLGYDYLNGCFRNFGLITTRIHPEGMSLASTLAPSKDNYTTPREMGSLLEKLYKHELVNDGLSDLMLEIMKGADSNTRLKEHLPAQWKLARKTGLLRKYCHDVGIVYTPQGDYVLCVLTGHNRTYRKAKGFIASVGRTAYNYLGNS